MTPHAVLGGLAVLLGLVSQGIYARGILKGRFKPHGFTWLVWSLLTGISFAAQYVEGAGPGAWIMLQVSVFDFAVAMYGFSHKDRDITRADWAVFLSALTAIPVWRATNDPLWAVVIVSVIDSVSIIPTLRKSWNKPHGEGVLPFAVAALQFLISVIAMENRNLATVLYPVVIAFFDLVLVFTLLWRRKVVK
jgi:hypothetical protein